MEGTAFFFFNDFYNELYNEIPEIKNAFNCICLDKMLSDGYFDMSKYIFDRINKDTMLAKLTIENSRYIDLYKDSFSTHYPAQGSAANAWNELIRYHDDNKRDDKLPTKTESEAIVNWVYRTMESVEELIEFTKNLMRKIKSATYIPNDIAYKDGVVYNKKTVNIRFVSSISELSTFLSEYNFVDKHIFYRGHADANYMLLPSVMRTEKLHNNERAMYNELIINCPENFKNCHTHLEKLVEMQHYGLPTRLLDITGNPLVALYFACKDDLDCYGELVIISTDEHTIKYPQSDTVSILSSLPLLSRKEQEKIKDLANDKSISVNVFNRKIEVLIQEIRLEKPAFQKRIIKGDLLNSYIVRALKANNRIIKQDGAFIICGLIDSKNPLNKFKLKVSRKKVIVMIKNKNEIIEQLERFSINQATLFPEIDHVSAHIKKSYS